VTFHQFGKTIRVWLEAVLFVSTESDSEDTIFTHHEFAISEFLFETFEIVS